MGTEWALRIEDAIAGTTFFMPVLTPKYFRSQSCRDELMSFTRTAARLGLEQLLMPVYWVTVPALHADPEQSPDEAIRLVARFQWQDLREVRLEDEDSAPFRKAVAVLADALSRRAREVTSTAPDTSVSEKATAVPRGDEDDDVGLLENIAAAEDGFPTLNETMERIGTLIEVIGTAVAEAYERWDVSPAPSAKASLIVTEALAGTLAEPCAELEQLGHLYAEQLGSLDPGVHSLLDVVEMQSDPTEEQRRDSDEFLATVEGLAEAADGALTQLQALQNGVQTLSRFSRSLKAPLRRMRTGLSGVLDGRAVIAEWGRRASELRGVR